jgi:hypothetical protein
MLFIAALLHQTQRSGEWPLGPQLASAGVLNTPPVFVTQSKGRQQQQPPPPRFFAQTQLPRNLQAAAIAGSLPFDKFPSTEMSCHVNVEYGNNIIAYKLP